MSAIVPNNNFNLVQIIRLYRIVMGMLRVGLLTFETFPNLNESTILWH